MTRVVLSYYGSVKDAGLGRKRWSRWRPTVSLAQGVDLAMDRLELLHAEAHREGAEGVAADMRELLPELDVRLRSLDFDDPWDFEEVYERRFDFARGYRFDLEAEEYLVHITTGTHVMQICWFLLTESRHVPAKLVQTSPPEKAGKDLPGRYRVIDLDLSRYDRLAQRFATERDESLAFLKNGIATRNPAFNALIERIETVALRSREPMLLMGPTGAGKSHLASQIVALRQRRKLVGGAFVEVNCATIRGDGAMSALFGHVRGAFTGAQSARAGLLRAADGGVLFLDEIGELGLEEQAMVLRAVEHGRFRPVGTEREEEVDVQLIAGTNRDLGAEVAAGRFREDLLARIQLWTFRLPGLRDRPEDIAPNLDHELRRAGSRLGAKLTMNAEARARFLAFATDPATPWRGNFRDFGAAVLRMGTLARGGRIDAATVEGEIVRLKASWARPGDVAGPDADQQLLEALLGAPAVAALDRFDRVQLADAVRACRESPSLSAAGRVLFAASRQRRRSTNAADRLRKYLARFGLDWDRVHALSG